VIIWFLVLVFFTGYIIAYKVQTKRKHTKKLESLRNEFKDIIDKNPKKTVDYACEFLRIYGEEPNNYTKKFKLFLQLHLKEKGNVIDFELRNAHKIIKAEKELLILNNEFKAVLDKNPKEIDDYINIFFEIYGIDYTHTIDEFKKLMCLKFSLDKEAIESKINEGMLRNSNEYELIQSFVKKYESDCTKYDYLNNLYLLLKQKKVNLEISSLKNVVESEFLKQDYDLFKKRIIRTEPSTREEFIKVFLELYPDSNSTYLDYFNELMLRLGFEKLSIYNIPHYKKEIELKSFEKRLNNDCMRRYSIWHIDIMNGFEFEDFLAKLYQNMGYSIERTPYSKDQGADLIVSKYGEKSVIQAKNYSDKVSNKAVQEVVAAKGFYKCERATVVTNNYFTNSAVDLAKANDVELIDRNKLELLIARYL
jgi:HJR/Mrr/RecB family endonuclease